MDNKTIGVLLMAYGGPDSLQDIPSYLLDVREGRPTSQELIEEISENYRKIGGKSPILELTRQQAVALEKELNRQGNYKVYIGMRHWSPWIKDAVEQMIKDGVEQAVALVLAPHYSSMSIGKYFKRLDEALENHPNPFTYERIVSYHDHPLFIEALAQRVRQGLANLPADTHVIFSAHSLPVRIIREGDPYDTQLRETAALTAEKAGLSESRWSFCYQSAGRSQEPWLGPQLDEYVAELADKGHRSLLSVVIGFVCDHVEVLFDIDIRAKEIAREKGVRLERAPSLNDDPLFIRTLVDLILQKVKETA